MIVPVGSRLEGKCAVSPSQHVLTYSCVIHTPTPLQKTPTNFDASIDELWTSLTAGAPLVVAPPEAHRDVHSVMMLITRCVWACGVCAHLERRQ